MPGEVKIIKYNGSLQAINKGLEAGILQTAINVVKEAKSLAPVDEGVLRNSIMYKTKDEDGGFNDGSGKQADKQLIGSSSPLTGYVGSNLFYAPYMEFGTRKVAPRPFLRPAVLIVKGRDIKEVADRIKKETAKGPIGKNPEVKRDLFR